MKKYRKNMTHRIPARAAAETRHLTARSGLEVMLYELLQHALVQKERRNDLPDLTPQRARELYEAYRRGEMADVQLMWDQLEERDETLFTVLHARLGALAEMPWAVNIDADLSEDRQALAEQQQQLANELLAAVENLPEALTHLGMADFRGVAALEVTGNAARMRWEVIEPWNLCRPVRRGPWYYNAEASSTPTRPEELDPAAVIIREAQPIDLPAMFLICAKYLSVHAWDAFLEVFGIPNIFLEMPPATPEGKAMEFDAIVQRLIGEGRGTVPSGAKFHTVETSKDNTQSFEARAKWCNEAIIQLATGGLLTVTTQSGSGTLAGNAHSDSFSRLCAATARSISAAINRQFLRPALQEAFPHSPMLVSFELAPEPVDDRLQLAQLLGAVNSAGFRPSAETVSELMNFEVQPVQEAGPGQPPVVNGRGLPGFVGTEPRSVYAEATPLRNSGESELPLNEGELAALRALGGELNPAQIAADADYMTREMMAGLGESDELENRDYKRSSDGRFASTGAGQKNPRHKRASKGNPKNPTTKSNTPLKAAPGAKAQAKVDAMEHALQKTAQKGGQVQDAVKIGDSSLTITSGVAGDKSNDYKGGKGSVHQFEKHGKGGKGKEQTSFRKVAKAAVLGDKSKDREKDTVLSDHHTTQAVYANKPKHTADFISGYKRKKPKSGTRAN